jgi:hypothetical protein
MKSFSHLTGILTSVVLAGFLVGCASIGAPVPPSLELPKPPTDLRATRKGNKVYLSWSVPTRTTDRQNVRRPGPTRICRSQATVMSQCDTPVGNVGPTEESAEPARNGQTVKLRAEFVDTLPAVLQQQDPTGTVTYAVEPLNLEARSAGLSNQVQVPLTPALPPPENVSAQVAPGGVVLAWAWTPPALASSALHFTCRIYRRPVDTPIDSKLADVDCSSDRYEDHFIDWQKTYEYRINVVTSAGMDLGHPADVAVIEGDDSPGVKIFANDVYPPAVPTGVQAVFSGPGQPPFIDLIWAPNGDSDLAGYDVYRHEIAGAPVKINPELVKSPAYRDPNVAPGKAYYYSVSAVDLRGNESARSEEASESVPQN